MLRIALWNLHTYAYAYMQNLHLSVGSKQDLSLFIDVQMYRCSSHHINMNACVYIDLSAPEIEI